MPLDCRWIRFGTRQHTEDCNCWCCQRGWYDWRIQSPHFVHLQILISVPETFTIYTKNTVFRSLSVCYRYARQYRPFKCTCDWLGPQSAPACALCVWTSSSTRVRAADRQCTSQSSASADFSRAPATSPAPASKMTLSNGVRISCSRSMRASVRTRRGWTLFATATCDLIYTISLYSNYDSTEVVLCTHRPSAFRSTRATSRERRAIARSPLSHALRHPLRDSRLSVFRSVRRARIRSVRLCGGTSRNSMKRLLLKMHSYSIWCFKSIVYKRVYRQCLLFY